MDEHHRIEREADEAFAAFRKKWPADDAGDPTGAELWHHAWRAAVAAERERMKALAHSRAGYEAASAAHHAGKWQPGFEMHMTRNAAMCELIDVLFGTNVRAKAPAEGASP